MAAYRCALRYYPMLTSLLLAIIMCICAPASAQSVSDSIDATPKTGKFKNRIRHLYNKLDSTKATHKYIQQINKLSDDVSHKYKKIDSIARNDSGSVGKIYHAVIPTKKVKADSNVIAVKKENTVAAQTKTAEIAAPPPATEPAGKGASNLVDLGNHYLQLNNTDEALSYYLKGLHAARATNEPIVVQEALKGLSETYDQKKNGSKALFYYQQYIAVRDSLLQTKNEKEINELRAQIELAKNRGEIQSLAEDGAKKGTELNRSLAYIQQQGRFITLIAVCLILSILLAIALFRQYKNKKKAAVQLQLRNDQIEAQQITLEENLAYTSMLKEALKEDLDRYMQMALRKQMNPHFIFNSLNSIQSYILQNDKLSANIYLSKFSGLMRKVLENSRHEYITLEKEIEVLQLYVSLEEQRFDNTFSCDWDIDEHLLQHLIPPLILQPYVENAIWHGLMHKKEDRMLKVSLTNKDDVILCIVEDNGVGREAAMKAKKNKHAGGSLGTRITQKRIELLNSLNNTGIGIAYEDLANDGKPCGTRVRVSIPLKIAVAINEDI